MSGCYVDSLLRHLILWVDPGPRARGCPHRAPIRRHLRLRPLRSLFEAAGNDCCNGSQCQQTDDRELNTILVAEAREYRGTSAIDRAIEAEPSERLVAREGDVSRPPTRIPHSIRHARRIRFGIGVPYTGNYVHVFIIAPRDPRGNLFG